MSLSAGSATEMPRVLYVMTSAMAWRLVKGQLRFLRQAGFDVCAASAPGEELNSIAAAEGARVYAVSMKRGISPLSDLVSLWQLWRLMLRTRPTITNVGTPKAGLLAGLAAKLAGVPCRVYTLRGLRSETATAWNQRLLRKVERLACASADRVLCVSESLRRRAVELGIVDPDHCRVLAGGSGNGVDAARFEPTAARLQAAADLRRRLSIPAQAPVIGFVGRFTRDKGISELVEACQALRNTWPALRLLLVGCSEEGDPLPRRTREATAAGPQIVCPGFVDDAAPYYHVMDIFALPTYREGFPNTVLEAHAAGKPVVTTHATGAVDSVRDGETGWLVPVGDVDALRGALDEALRDRARASQMGMAGRERVLQEFQQTVVWAALCREYFDLLRTKGLPGHPLAHPQPESGVSSPGGAGSRGRVR